MSESYESPTWSGWSMYSILTFWNAIRKHAQNSSPPTLSMLAPIKDTNLVVPAIRVQDGILRVWLDVARPVLRQQPHEARTPWPTVHPYRKGCVGRIVAGLEEPKESVDAVVLVLVDIVERAWWKMHIARIASDTGGRFTDECLGEFVS